MSHGLHKMLQLSQLRKWMQYDCLSQQQLGIHRTCTETAKRAFSVAAPNVWNSLPIDIRNTNSLLTFRNKLKTHFFTAVYTWRDIPTTAPLFCILSLDRLHGAVQVWFYVYVINNPASGRTASIQLHCMIALNYEVLCSIKDRYYMYISPMLFYEAIS